MATCGIVDGSTKSMDEIPYFPDSIVPTVLPGAPPGFELRESGSKQPLLVTRIPKGTLLFRGVKQLKTLEEDVAGIKLKTSFCCPQTHGVYFYPFPFADRAVYQYPTYAIYVLTRDVQIGCFISPSPMSRSDKIDASVPIVACGNKTNFGCGLVGRFYDPCFKSSFQEKNPDVVGLIGIAAADRASYLYYKRLGTFPEPIPEYVDRRFPHEGGIPEIVLHPFRRATMKEVKQKAFDGVDGLAKYMEDRAGDLNYKLFYLMNQRTNKAIVELMNALRSPEGFEHGGVKWHAKVNKETGFYQIVEMSESFPMTDDRFFQGPPFRFVRPKPKMCGSTGGTRRRRGHDRQTRRHGI